MVFKDPRKWTVFPTIMIPDEYLALSSVLKQKLHFDMQFNSYSIWPYKIHHHHHKPGAYLVR